MSWRDRAECLGAPSEWFFARSADAGQVTQQMQQGLDLCAQCQVRADCLGWALETNQTHGVLGGTVPVWRARVRRRRLGLADRGQEPRQHKADLAVLGVLESGTDRTKQEIAERLGVSTRSVQRALRSLAADWPVYYRDVYRGRVYFVAGRGKRRIRKDARKVLS